MTRDTFRITVIVVTLISLPKCNEEQTNSETANFNLMQEVSCDEKVLETCPGCTIIHSANKTYRYIGSITKSYKLMDARGIAIIDREVDARCNVVDSVDFAKRDYEWRLLVQGNLADDVYNWTISGREEEQREFDIWLNTPLPSISLESNELSDAELDDNYAIINQEISDRTHADYLALQSELESVGINIVKPAQYAPILRATLDIPHIDLLKYNERIAKIYFTINEARPMGCATWPQANSTVWMQAVKANLVHNAGNFGQDIRVAAKEGCRLEVGDEGNFDDLISIAQPSVPPACETDHISATMEYINTIDGSLYGIAPGSELYVQNDVGYSNMTYPTTDEWAHYTYQTTVKNFSACFGSEFDGNAPNAASSWHDYIGYYYHNSIAESAGNAWNQYVCNKTYNSIKVGMTGDCNTAVRTDDQINNYAWRNPTYGAYDDRELPEVVAPGTSMTTAHYGPWTGTSMASPVIAATQALVQSRNNTLKYYPEAVKAIIMATATCNISGSDNPLLDADADDGAGEVDSYNAHLLAYSGYKVDGGNTPGIRGYDYGYMNFTWPSQFDSNGWYYEVYKMKTTVYDRKARILLTWAAKPTCDLAGNPPSPAYRNCWDDLPDADLDIYVWRWDGLNWYYVGGSATYENNYEMMSFPINRNDEYWIMINRKSYLRNDTRFSLAWWTSQNVACQ